MSFIYHVRVASGLFFDCIGNENLSLACGDQVVVHCDHYEDLGTVSCCNKNHEVSEEEAQEEFKQSHKGRKIEGEHIPEILRKATDADLEQADKNVIKAEEMYSVADDMIIKHQLDMKLVDTHCSLDRKLAVFQFSAEGRVDFRKLLRDLSSHFHVRVELRQIGVRDEAAICGGIGPCGREFCCSSFLKEFYSINVKMAKLQGLSLNPTNISGCCGRLKCCLRYEYNWYQEENERARKIGNLCTTPDGTGRVVDWDIENKIAHVEFKGKQKTVKEYPFKKISWEKKRDKK